MEFYLSLVGPAFRLTFTFVKRCKSGAQKKKQAAAVQETEKNLIKLTQFFHVAAADAEDNVTQQLLNPVNDNSNFPCAAESASESENTLSELVEQNQPSTSAGVTSPENTVDTSALFV